MYPELCGILAGGSAHALRAHRCACATCVRVYRGGAASHSALSVSTARCCHRAAAVLLLQNCEQLQRRGRISCRAVPLWRILSCPSTRRGHDSNLPSCPISTGYLGRRGLWRFSEGSGFLTQRCHGPRSSGSAPALFEAQTLSAACFSAARANTLQRPVCAWFGGNFTRIVAPGTVPVLARGMPRGVAKANLPTKVCVQCRRPFTWRKKCALLLYRTLASVDKAFDTSLCIMFVSSLPALASMAGCTGAATCVRSCTS